jgi:outer membrane receptor protein involved in Fe transport
MPLSAAPRHPSSAAHRAIRGPALAVTIVALILARPAVSTAEESAPTAGGQAADAAAEDAAVPPGAAGDSEPSAETEEEASGAFFATTTVTATGQRTESFRVPVPVLVIDDIEEQVPDNAADLLRVQPGVDVNGVGPNQARPIIRGQRGLRVLFLENGLRMNNARRQTDFGEIPGLVDIESVETVEVVRGPASVLYGTDAIGGVLNLVTATPSWSDQTQGALRLRGSTAGDQLKGTGSVAGAGEAFAYQLGATWRDADDYEAPSGSFGDITLDEDATVIDTGIQDTSFWGRLDYRLSDQSDLFLRFNRYRADETGFGFIEPTLLGESDDFRIRITYPFQDFDKLTLGYDGYGLELGLLDGFEGQIYYQANERQLVNDIFIDIGPIFPGAPASSVQADTTNFTDLETLGTRLQATKTLGDANLLTYGAELFQDDSFNTDSSVTTTTIRLPFPPFEIPSVSTDDVANAPNATNTSYGVFAQDELLLDELALTFGARYQSVETRAESTPGWDTSGLDFDDGSLVGAINALYQISPVFNLAGSVGTAFRAPSIVERLFNGPTPEGAGYQILNPELRSEESLNYDIGFKYLDRRAYLNATYFKNEIDDGIIQYFLSEEEILELPQDVQDEIATLGPNTFVVQQRNIERLEYEGFEVDGGYRFDNGVSLGANYTYIDSKRLDSTNPPTGDTFGDKLNVFARYERPSGRWWAEYRLRHNGDEKANLDANEPVPPVGEVLPAFTVHRLAGGVALDAGSLEHRLGLTVDNLTDELYAEFSNATFFRPQPGRTYVVSYDLRF